MSQSMQEARNAASTREGQARAKYNFTGQTQLELSFRKGDILRLIRRVDSNWYEGRVQSSSGTVGRRGIFPVSYVQTIVEPQSAPTTPVSSAAPSPLPEERMLSGQLSPVSSMSGPTRPSAPMSPVNFDDYSSDWDFDFDRRTDESFQRDAGQGARSTADVFDPAHQVGGTGSGGGHPSSTSIAAGAATRRGHGAYDGGSAADVGLFSFDEARRVLDELNERLRSYGGSGSGGGASKASRTTSAASAGSAPRDVQGSENHRGREHSSADGSGRTATTRGGIPNSDAATGPRTSAWNGDAVRGGSKRNGTDKHRSNYPAYRVLYDYKPRNEDELELTEGDVVEVMERCDDGWFVGLSRRTNEFGTFPGNYVQKV